MTKLILITLLSTLTLYAAMHMQTVQTKKIVVGTFKSADALNNAKRLLAGNSVLQRIQQQNNFLMTTRNHAGNTTLILENFKTMRMALDAFVAVSRHYPKAYLLDDSYTVAVEPPTPPVTPPHYVAPITTTEPSPPVEAPQISEATVAAVAQETVTQEESPDIDIPVKSSVNTTIPLSETNNSTEFDAETQNDAEPIIIVVTEAGSEAERLAIQKALEKNNSQRQADRQQIDTNEEEVVVTEIEEIPFDEPNTTAVASQEEEIVDTTSNSTVITGSVIDEERYKRKPKEQEESFLSTSTLIYILIAVILLLLILLWRRSRDVDVHKILGDQQRY